MAEAKLWRHRTERLRQEEKTQVSTASLNVKSEGYGRKIAAHRLSNTKE